MSDAPQPKARKGGCLPTLGLLFVLLVLGGLGTGVYFITRPQDLSDIAGYGFSPAAAPTRNDMVATLKYGIDNGKVVTVTENDINHWLKKTLHAKQGGLLAGQVSLERVWVRLEDGHAEIVMERKAFGRPFTVSMYLQVERMQTLGGVETQVRFHGAPFHASLPKPPRGGRFGQLVVPPGFLHLLKPAYQKLAEQYRTELDLALTEMSRIEIKKDELILDPREPLGDHGMPSTF